MEADLKTPEDKQLDEGDSDGEHSEALSGVRPTGKMKADTNNPSGNEIDSKKFDDDEAREREMVGGVSMESSLRVIFRILS